MSINYNITNQFSHSENLADCRTRTRSCITAPSYNKMLALFAFILDLVQKLWDNDRSFLTDGFLFIRQLGFWGHPSAGRDTGCARVSTGTRPLWKFVYRTLDIPWISRVKTSKCVVKEAMWVVKFREPLVSGCLLRIQNRRCLSERSGGR